jgi:hypothetical protein
MRELAKSMVGFSWAVGLFGFQQLNKMMGTVVEPEQVTAAQLDDVSRAAQRHLSDQFSQQFQAGDMWQRRVIDALFDAASMRSLDPRNMAASLDPRPLFNDVDPRAMFQGGMDLMQRTFDMVRPAASSAQPAAAHTTE